VVAALGFEWRRIATTRAMWVLCGLTILLGAGYLLFANGRTLDADSVLTTPATLGGFLMAALGALAIGPEYRFGTIRTTLALFPRREQIFTAKVAVALAVGVTAGLAAIAVCAALGAAAGTSIPPAAATLDAVVRCLTVMGGWLLIGLGLAALARNTTLGIVGPLVFALAVEGLLVGTVDDHAPWIDAVLPFHNANAALRSGSPWPHLVVYALWVAAIVGSAFFSFRRRDV
jgi:ABC-type transport system involved in multi-copper enzyme maturation permease subunit